MTASLNSRQHTTRSLQAGFALIVCLIMLLVMSLLSVGIYRSANLQERLAGNTREKQRALEAAQSALRYAEWWLGDGSGLGTATGVVCAGKTVISTPADMKVCSNALAKPEDLPWPDYSEYTPPAMTVASGGGLLASGDINYEKPPALHIYYMGSAAGGGSLYQISAVGYGGSATAVAVLQSVYKISAGKTVALYRP